MDLSMAVAEICKENSVSSEMVQKYFPPEVLEKMLPS